MIVSRFLSAHLLLLFALSGAFAGKPVTAANADWTPLPSHEVGAVWVVVDDYALGSFAGGYHGGDGNRVTVTPERAGSAASLRVEYTSGDSDHVDIVHNTCPWSRLPICWSGLRRKCA